MQINKAGKLQMVGWRGIEDGFLPESGNLADLESLFF